MTAKRILLRSRKDPFTVATPERTLQENLIGNNTGNLIFSHASHKILQTRGTDVVSTRGGVDPEDAERINDEFDVFVVPLANAFRRSFEASLVRLTELIERLNIPVVVLGVGAQASLDYDTTRLKRIERSVSRFVRAVLDRSATIGVRGELSAEYLHQLGFHDVDVIGCPSLFMHGPGLRVEKDRPVIGRDARLSINVSPYVKAMGPVVSHHLRMYPELVYVAQDLNTLELLLRGDPVGTNLSGDLPIYTSHPLFTEDKIRLFVDPWPWLQFLSTRTFSFGTRIHGNIAAVLAGTPCCVLAHDSRTLELARYFELPYRKISAQTPDMDAAELYAEADYGPFNRGHRARFDTFVDFLGKHDLAHVFAPGENPARFDAQVQRLSFPPAVRARGSRLKRLRAEVHQVGRRVAVRALGTGAARKAPPSSGGSAGATVKATVTQSDESGP